MKPDTYPLDEKYWDKVKKFFVEGKLDRIQIWSNLNKEQIYGPRILISVNIADKIYEKRKFNISSIEFSVHKGFYAHEIIPQYISDTFIELIEGLSIRAKNLAGYITFDRTYAEMANLGSKRSPYEVYLTKDFSCRAPLLHKFYRGYYWGNFLSKEHVELLGGIDYVLGQAPVFQVKALSDGGAYLQLTEDINDFSDESLRNLKEFLTPILPKREGKIHKGFKVYYRGMRLIENEEEE